ncbi:MAG: 16S rRNA (cytosine(1402)-N(4))-methyltransferase RsmH [Bacteroidales bacterium]|nr:16S rRNA (cytosine(1402)-N(4))-methyltransferase RsmH [Bacteroidales bacterium]MDE7072342.1 16S rRNA (cytosine(1402)-N(4))-methyltransferase RsmH [Bacteroidales bacterium]
MDTAYHDPVLLQESIEGLDIQSEGIYVDATFGGGGHSRRILSRLGEGGRLYAFDRDPDAVKRAAEDPFFTQAGGRFELIAENFRFMKNHLRFRKALPVNGILADLGVSSHQFDTPERGFSIRGRGPLDMRMDQKSELTASAVLNTYSEEDLARVFCRYGEIPFGKRLASAVVKARSGQTFDYTDRAVAFFTPFAQKGRENKFLAMVFQSLRIEVNGEMENLENLLQQSLDMLVPGGRLAVISYHSLEDRMVKNFMRSGNLEGVVEKDFYGNNLSPFEPVTRKAVVASEEEVARNPRSRSARLRIVRKKER